MNVIFISSRDRGRLGQGVNRQQNRTGDTVNITVPCDLVITLKAATYLKLEALLKYDLHKRAEHQSNTI